MVVCDGVSGILLIEVAIAASIYVFVKRRKRNKGV